MNWCFSLNELEIYPPTILQFTVFVVMVWGSTGEISWLRLVSSSLFFFTLVLISCVAVFFIYLFDVEYNIITRENCRLRKKQRWLILIFPLCTFYKFKFTTIPKITFYSDIFFLLFHRKHEKTEKETHKEIGFFKVSTVFTHLISSQCYISFLCMPLLWLWWMLVGWWLTTLVAGRVSPL